MEEKPKFVTYSNKIDHAKLQKFINPILRGESEYKDAQALAADLQNKMASGEFYFDKPKSVGIGMKTIAGIDVIVLIAIGTMQSISPLGTMPVNVSALIVGGLLAILAFCLFVAAVEEMKEQEQHAL